MPAQPQESSFLSTIKTNWNSLSTLNKSALGIAVVTGITSAAGVATGVALPLVGAIAVGGWAVASTAGVADFYVEKGKVATINTLKPHSDRNVKTKEQEATLGKAIEIEKPGIINQSNKQFVDNIKDSTSHLDSHKHSPPVTPKVNAHQPKRAGSQQGR